MSGDDKLFRVLYESPDEGPRVIYVVEDGYEDALCTCRVRAPRRGVMRSIELVAEEGNDLYLSTYITRRES